MTEVFLQVFFCLEDFPPRAREKSLPEPSQSDRTRDHVLGEELKETYLSCFDLQLGRHDEKQCQWVVSLNGFYHWMENIFVFPLFDISYVTQLICRAPSFPQSFIIWHWLCLSSDSWNHNSVFNKPSLYFSLYLPYFKSQQLKSLILTMAFLSHR